MTILNKSFNPTILNEIISFFENKIIICGSLVDYIHIDYQEPVSDYDFIINKSLFLYYFHQTSLEDNVIYNNFILKKKKSSFFDKISYIGQYKDLYTVDFFITESIDDDDIIEIDSNKIIQNTDYNKIMIHSVYSRIHQLNTVLTIKKKKGLPRWAYGWLKDKHKKAHIKLKLYQQLYSNIYDTFYF